jgi:hypothetical protein
MKKSKTLLFKHLKHRHQVVGRFFSPTVFNGLKNKDGQIFSLIGHFNQFEAFSPLPFWVSSADSTQPIRKGNYKILDFKKYMNY